jgi:RimJ/RimL family protein N-acetyltransferase
VPGSPFLRTDRLTLRPATTDDVDFLDRALNDPTTWRYRSRVRPASRADLRNRIESGPPNDGLRLLIVPTDADDSDETNDTTPVGEIALQRHSERDARWQRAELSVWLAPEGRGQGYATEASEAVLAHGFDQLNLHKIVAHCFAPNEPSRALLARLGFSEEGRRESEAYVDGEWTDILRYGLLRDTWREGV